MKNPLALLLLGLTVSAAASAAAADDIGPTGRRWAVLIGVDKYEHAMHLRFTNNDVEQLALTLRQHCGFTDDCLLTMVDGSAANFQPRRENMLKQIPLWLDQVGEEDEVILYFTGHGFRDSQGKLYLAPLDGDAQRPAETLVSIEWLRSKLDACKARTKILILDACHAGSDRGVAGPRSVSAKDLSEAFRESAGVITMASCTSGERSLMWDDMQQSLFSFWLNQALKGHADSNGDGLIDCDELYEFLDSQVKDSAKQVFDTAQTQVRIIGPKTHGTPVVVRLNPTTLKGLLDDMAEQLAHVVEVKRLTPVGVATFMPQTADPKLLELLKNESGALGDYCGLELQRRMDAKAKGRFQVIAHESLKKSLVQEKLTLRDLGSPALKDLAADGQPIAVVGIGSIVLRSGCTISLQCKLVDTRTQQVVGHAAGSAELQPDEWAMLGHSARVEPVRRDSRDPPENELKVRDADAQKKHPLDPERLAIEGRATPRFNVKVFVGAEERKPKFVGNDAYVSLHKDEVYRLEIEVAEEVKGPIFMRLLVDGLNTLPERAPAKAMEVEGKLESAPYRPAQRVNLTEARAWRLDVPKVRRWGVPGFMSKEDGAKSEYNEFLVTDAAASAASRQRYTDQIGLITAAFYLPTDKKAATRSALGSALGKRYNIQLDEYDGNQAPGNLIEVIQIHYVEPAP